MKRALPLLSALVLLPVFLLACGEPGEPGGGGPIVPEDAPDGPVIRLTFTDPDGVAVAGVKVLAQLPFGAGPAGVRGFTAVSDAEGVAILDVEGILEPKGDAPVIVRATAPGFVPKSWRIPGFAPGRGMGIQVRLDPAGAVAGRVADSAGNPVADAFVYLLKRGVPGFVREDEVFSARTDEQGGYRIDPAPTGIFHVGIAAEGYLPAAASNVEVAPKTRTTAPVVIVKPGLSISGRVETPDGGPVAGARVRAWRHAPIADDRFFGPEVFDRAGGIARTGEDGSFRISGLAPDEYTVDAAALGWSVVDASRPGVAAGADDVVLVLEKGQTLTLALRDAETKAPIEDFRLVISETEGGKDLQGRPVMRDDRTVHSPSGQVALQLRSGARYTVEIVADGYDVFRTAVGPMTPDTPPILPIDLTPRD